MELLFLRLAVFVALAAVYMLFDVFNNRNVPSLFAYASLAIGLVLTVLYFNTATITYSVLVAIAVLGLGYFVYRIGQLGAADVIEIAALSLIMPFFSRPLVLGQAQPYMPVAVSVAINSGIAALIIVPLYYIPKAMANKKAWEAGHASLQDYFKIVLIATVYAFFGAFLYLVLHASYAAIALLAVIALGSVLVLAFERQMMGYMTQYVTYRGMEEGDIIATGMLSEKELHNLESRLAHFERLVDAKLISELKKKIPKRKLPVYKKPIPFAVPIFAGVLLTVAFGNILLLLLPAYP